MKIRMRLQRWAYRLFWKSGWYLRWSKLYRELWQRGYANPVERGLSPDLVMPRMRLLTWTADGPRELWDAIGSPEWVQRCIDVRVCGLPQPAGALDCDEFACWASLALDDAYRPYVLNVNWRVRGSGRFLGHHVCVYQDKLGRLFHMGNWGVRGDFITEECIVRDIIADGELVGWAAWDARAMKLMRMGSTLS